MPFFLLYQVFFKIQQGRRLVDYSCLASKTCFFCTLSTGNFCHLMHPEIPDRGFLLVFTTNHFIAWGVNDRYHVNTTILTLSAPFL